MRHWESSDAYLVLVPQDLDNRISKVGLGVQEHVFVATFTNLDQMPTSNTLGNCSRDSLHALRLACLRPLGNLTPGTKAMSFGDALQFKVAAAFMTTLSSLQISANASAFPCENRRMQHFRRSSDAVEGLQRNV